MQKSKQKRAPAAQNSGGSGELVFLRAEDEALHTHAEWACSWAVPRDGEFEAQVRPALLSQCV